MVRASRLFDLLELLESSGTRNVAELADRLDVDERTVRRDIAALQDLGVPVESKRGRYGGYRIGAGYRMPPLMLNDDEALAVLYALLRTAAAAASAVQPAALATAMAKVRRSLPKRLAERAEALLQVAVLATPREAGHTPDGGVGDPDRVDADVLLTIAAAVRDRRPLELDYRNRTGETSRRSVQPHDLVAYAGRWYVAGFDAMSHQVRHFRIDRIRATRVLAGTFPQPPPHDPTADLIDRFAGADYRHLVTFRARATIADLRQVLPPSIAQPECLDDGWIHVSIHAESLAWLPSTLLALDREVIIEQPEELRTAVANAAARLGVIAQS